MCKVACKIPYLPQQTVGNGLRNKIRINFMKAQKVGQLLRAKLLIQACWGWPPNYSNCRNATF